MTEVAGGPPGPAERDLGDPTEGVRELEHTADLGIEVRAPDLPELFHRAAIGMLRVLGPDEREANLPGTESVIELGLAAAETDLLLSRWLREILYLRETEGLAYRRATFSLLTPHRLEARLVVAPASREPEREIKGITYHGLAAEERGGGWWARIIFDL
jgi:SHS2 domain-containing protein